MISILLPTCFRPALLREMLKSLRDTTQGYELEVIAVIDSDYESINIANLYKVDTIDFSETRRGALRCWNLALALSSGNIIVPCGDDQLFHKGWLEYALESHKEKLGSYGVVGMNDLAYDGNTQVATMFIFDRNYCKEQMGGIFAPPIFHYYCVDSFWNEKAKMLGKFWWEEKSIVEHIHSAHGKRPIDDLDKEKMDAGWMELDNKTLEVYRKRQFPVTWDAVI